jgi:hypothetical protein
MSRNSSDPTLAEFREFAGFEPCEQRYIKRSLDIGLKRKEPLATWARGRDEEYSIKAQVRVYEGLSLIRGLILEPFDPGQLVPKFSDKLKYLTAFDLGQAGLNSFSAYRFLYERLLGSEIRPWLPSSFCGAASLPHLSPERRKNLLQSISEAAATAPGWSPRQPFFFPEWVDKAT